MHKQKQKLSQNGLIPTNIGILALGKKKKSLSNHTDRYLTKILPGTSSPPNQELSIWSSHCLWTEQ